MSRTKWVRGSPLPKEYWIKNNGFKDDMKELIKTLNPINDVLTGDSTFYRISEHGVVIRAIDCEPGDNLPILSYEDCIYALNEPQQDLKIESLRLRNVAIQCNSQEEWDSILAITKSSLVTKWKTRICINVNGSKWDTRETYEQIGYSIVQAKDVIAANQPSTGYKVGDWITIARAGHYASEDVGRTLQLQAGNGPYSDGSFNYEKGKRLLSQDVENIRMATPEEIAKATQSTEGWKVGDKLPSSWLKEQQTYKKGTNDQYVKHYKGTWGDRKVERVEKDGYAVISATYTAYLPPKSQCTPLPTESKEWVPKVGDWMWTDVQKYNSKGKAIQIVNISKNHPERLLIGNGGWFDKKDARPATPEEIRKAQSKNGKEWICISEDGVELYDGDRVQWVNVTENLLTSPAPITKAHSLEAMQGCWALFSTEQAAKEWIEQQNNQQIQGKKWRIGDWFKMDKCHQILRVEGNIVYVSTSTGGEVEYTIAEVDRLYGGTWIPIAAPGESSTNQTINSQTKTNSYEKTNTEPGKINLRINPKGFSGSEEDRREGSPGSYKVHPKGVEGIY